MSIQTFSYEITRHVTNNEILPGICVFKDEVFRDGVEVSCHEGFAHLATFDSLAAAASIPAYECELRKGVKGILRLYQPGVPEYFRTHLFGKDESYTFVKEQLISKPYTYILEHGLDESQLLYVSFYDHHLYDIDCNVLPKAIHFDYTNGRVDNQNYNLSHFVDVLSPRSDIVWSKNGPKIEPIPYYNAERNRNQTLDFQWHPSAEDWQKVVPHVHNLWNFNTLIIEEVFGIPTGTGLGEPEDEDSFF